MRSAVSFTAALLSLALACAAEEPGPGEGQPCSEDQSCAEGLSCIELVCRDDRGPKIVIALPEPLTPFAGGEPLTIAVDAVVKGLAADDRVLLSLAPAGPDTLVQDAMIVGDSAQGLLSFPDSIPSGPYQVLAQVSDADARAYDNPSATARQPIFVRDATIPDTPQIAIVWPPPGYAHPLGVDLVVEVAVLPGSFEFVVAADQPSCAPLPDCTPAFAPECEDQCGPVIRQGHTKIYLEPDYPSCLLDQPIGCNGLYTQVLRPDTDTVTIAGSRARGVVPADRFDEAGPLKLSAALSYDYHDPYPSKEAVVYASVPITVVE